jgi:hypothetical protein
VDLDEVGHAAEPHTVDQVADGATGDDSEGGGTENPADVASQREHQDRHHDDEGERREQLVAAGPEPQRGTRITGEAEPEPAGDHGDLVARGELAAGPGLAALIEGEHQDGDGRDDQEGSASRHPGHATGGGRAGRG